MVFTQQVNFDDVFPTKEIMKICEEHSCCKECPLLKEDMNINGVLVRCDTGRAKGENN